MAKERLDFNLKYVNGNFVFSERKQNKMFDVNSILTILRSGMKVKEIHSIAKIEDDKNIRYNFEIVQTNEKTEKREKSKISIKVSKEYKDISPEIIEQLDDFVEMSVIIKKQNRTRIMALAACTVTLLAAYGASLASFVGERLSKESEAIENTNKVYSQPYNDSRNFDEWEEQYRTTHDRSELLERAHNGDNEALDELLRGEPGFGKSKR